MPQDLEYIPNSIVSGESIWVAAANTLGNAADIVITGYLPTTHTLTYSFHASTPVSVTADANGDNTGWTLDVTGAQTALWYAGRIQFVGMATNTSSGRITAVDRGAIKVYANPTLASEYASVLTSIDAAIADYADNPFGSISIGPDTNITYRNLDQLIQLRNHYQDLVNRQTASRPCRIIRAKFT